MGEWFRLSSPGGHDHALVISEFVVPRLCDLNRPSAVIGSAEWALACHIDGLATVGKLAERSSIAPHDAIERVSRLVQAGLCAVVPAPDTSLAEDRPTADAALALPRRVRQAVPVAAEARAARLDRGLLKQILDGLNSLN